jgi:hypothetical protein
VKAPLPTGRLSASALFLVDQSLEELAVGQVGGADRLLRPGTAHQADVLRAVVDQQIDVLRGPDTAVSDDREAPDQDVTRARFVQRATDPDEVVDLRCASVRAIVWFSQASASSKLAKR